MLPGKKSWAKNKSDEVTSANLEEGFSPLRPIGQSDFATIDFTGEDINRPHKILWDLDNYIQSKGGLPAFDQSANVVVVGGGVSGLSACHFLKDFSPILLEGSDHFGGNSRGESWKGNAFSIGAAYICKPEEGDEVEKFLNEIGISPSDFREEGDDEVSVLFKNKFLKGFWQGHSDEESRGQFSSVLNKMKQIYDESYPDLPLFDDSAENRERFNQLDSQNFEEWLALEFPSLNSHIKELFCLYCWSSFGGDISEISAAQALNFITADLSGIQTLPGGNSALTQKLYQQLKNQLPKDSLRFGHFVLDIKHHDQGVDVAYEGPDGKIKVIRAKACLFAGNKKVAKHIIKQVDQEQSKAMEKISYRSYLVANVLLKKKIEAPAYDLFVIKDQIPTDAKEEADKRMATDLIFANWADDAQANQTILTLYIPRAYQGAEHFLFSSFAHDKYKDKAIKKMQEWLGALELSMDDVEALRMTRWGHAMPLAKTGLISSGMLEKAHQTIAGKIFFAGQDNWANPCFETAFESARVESQKIKELLMS